MILQKMHEAILEDMEEVLLGRRGIGCVGRFYSGSVVVKREAHEDCFFGAAGRRSYVGEIGLVQA